MKIRGIRISDTKNRVVCLKLSDILEVVPNGDLFYWRILLSDVTPNSGEEKFIIELEKQIEFSERGVSISWEELNVLSKKIFQEIDLTIVACKSELSFLKYKEYKDIYEICDIIIEMIDSSFWEVRSNNYTFIDKLAKKFNDVEFLSLNTKSNEK